MSIRRCLYDARLRLMVFLLLTIPTAVLAGGHGRKLRPRAGYNVFPTFCPPSTIRLLRPSSERPDVVPVADRAPQSDANLFSGNRRIKPARFHVLVFIDTGFNDVQPVAAPTMSNLAAVLDAFERDLENEFLLRGQSPTTNLIASIRRVGDFPGSNRTIESGSAASSGSDPSTATVRRGLSVFREEVAQLAAQLQSPQEADSVAFIYVMTHGEDNGGGLVSVFSDGGKLSQSEIQGLAKLSGRNRLTVLVTDQCATPTEQLRPTIAPADANIWKSLYLSLIHI